MTNERRQALFPALRTVLVVCLLVAVAAPTHAELPKPRTGDIDLFIGEDAYNMGDYGKALRQFRIAAEKGKMSSGSAQFYLGVMYDNGQGVPQDYATAVKWYRKSANQGYAKAQNNLGVMYDDGQGVPQDYAQAVKWYRKAATQGYARAQNNLGVMYHNGQGVPRTTPRRPFGSSAPPRPASPRPSIPWGGCVTAAASSSVTTAGRSPGTAGPRPRVTGKPRATWKRSTRPA